MFYAEHEHKKPIFLHFFFSFTKMFFEIIWDFLFYI